MRSSVLPTAVAERCAPVLVQEFAQLQLVVDERSLREKGVAKNGRVADKTREQRGPQKAE